MLSAVAGGRHLLSLYHIRFVQLEHQWRMLAARYGTVPASTNVASKSPHKRAACMILRRLMTSICQILFFVRAPRNFLLALRVVVTLCSRLSNP